MWCSIINWYGPDDRILRCVMPVYNGGILYVLDVPTSRRTNRSKLYALRSAASARCARLSKLWLVQRRATSAVCQRCPEYAGSGPAGELQRLYPCAAKRAARYVLCSTGSAGEQLSARHERLRAGELLSTAPEKAWPQCCYNTPGRHRSLAARGRRQH